MNNIRPTTLESSWFEIEFDVVCRIHLWKGFEQIVLFVCPFSGLSQIYYKEYFCIITCIYKPTLIAYTGILPIIGQLCQERSSTINSPQGHYNVFLKKISGEFWDGSDATFLKMYDSFMVIYRKMHRVPGWGGRTFIER